MKVKLRKKIFYSLLFSLAIHFLFLIWSFFVKILPVQQTLNNPERFIHVKISKEENIGQEETPASETLAPEKLVQPENPFTETKVLEPPVESRETVRDNIASSVQKENQPPVLTPADQSRDMTKDQVNDVSISRKVKRATRKELVEIGEIPSQDANFGSPVVISGENVSKDFLDKSNVARKLAPAAAARAASGQNEFAVMKHSPAGITKKSQTSDLGTSLTYELSQYQDPKSGQKYFKLLIKVKDATLNFPVIPKELIFLVDASRSIGNQRFNQFVQGVTYSLKHLNPEDRFNVLIFKDKTIPFSEASLPPNETNVKSAIGFLKGLKVGSTTDVYNALKESLNLQNSFNPSYRVLLSDGFPTRGIVDSRQVINQISAMNNNQVSIFSFGGGVDVSPYMLDFIAYKNRGWSEVVDREYNIGKGLSAMYDRIKDPLLLNLRYHVSGLNDKEMFPQILPDFFKGSELVVYGLYTNEDKFYIQVLGNVRSAAKEFTITASMKEAVPGSKDIARQWAFHKIYNLIGQIKYSEDNGPLIDAIDELCSKYNIITPYSKNFRKFKGRPRAAKTVPAPAQKPPSAPGKKAPPQSNFAGKSASAKK